MTYRIIYIKHIVWYLAYYDLAVDKTCSRRIQARKYSTKIYMVINTHNHYDVVNDFYLFLWIQYMPSYISLNKFQADPDSRERL